MPVDSVNILSSATRHGNQWQVLKADIAMIGLMAIKKRSSGGRPSKGPRHSFDVKLDIPRAEKLVELIELLGTNGVDYLSPIIAEHLDAIDLDAIRNQEALPIAKAG